MTLNAVIAFILRFLSPNSTDFQADYITVVEDRPIMSVKYCFPVLVFYFWRKLYQTLQRGLSAILSILLSKYCRNVWVGGSQICNGSAPLLNSTHSNYLWNAFRQWTPNRSIYIAIFAVNDGLIGWLSSLYGTLLVLRRRRTLLDVTWAVSVKSIRQHSPWQPRASISAGHRRLRWFLYSPLKQQCTCILRNSQLFSLYTVSQKTSPMFLAITRESIVKFS